MLSSEFLALFSSFEEFTPNNDAVKHARSIADTGEDIFSVAVAYDDLRLRGYRVPAGLHSSLVNDLADCDEEYCFAGWQLRNQLLEDGPAPVAA